MLRLNLKRYFLITLSVVSLFLLTFAFRGGSAQTRSINAPLAPITVTKNAPTISTDNKGVGFVNPGDVLTYTITVSNGGSDASSVIFTDVLDSNLTLVPGSVNSSPIATNDVYSVLGNVSISVPDGASDLLANDVDPDGNALTISSAQTTSANGGNVAVNTTTGAFTYNPPAGFEGADSFTYTVSDGTATNQATVTLNVSGIIFFVNNSAAACTSRAAGCGRLSNPYSSLAAFQAENNGIVGSLNPSAGDNIFIYESATAYTGGVTLLSGQKLIGQDSTQTLASITGLTPPTFSAAFPAMNTAGNATTIQNSGGVGVTLNSGNTLNGFTAGNASSLAISGVNFGTLSVGDVIINNTTGRALFLDTGTVAGTGFTSVTSTSGTINVALTNIAGTLNLGGGALSGATAAALDIAGGTATINYAGTINSAARPVEVTGKTGGALNLSGAISETGGTGIFLDSNTGATINFTGGLSLSTGANAAFTATGGGTINVTQNNTTIVNTLTTTTGTALNVNTTTIGANGLTFRSITSNSSGTANGIILDTTGTSGGLTVTGNGGTCTSSATCTGGTISNKTGADGSTTQGTGIYLNSTAGVSLTNMQLNDFQNFGIRGTSVTGFTLNTSRVTGTNGTLNSGAGIEGSVRFDNLFTSAAFPTAAVTGSTITGGAGNTFYVNNTSGTLNRLTVSSTTFANTTSGSNNGLIMALQFTANGNITVQDSIFTAAAGNLFQAVAQNSNQMDVVLRRNKFSNNHPTISNGGGGVKIEGSAGAPNNPTVTYDVSCNTFRDARGVSLIVFKGNGGGTFTGAIVNNTFGVSGVSNSGGASGIEVDANGVTGSHTTLIQDNVIRRYNNLAGIYLSSNDSSAAGGATLNATVYRNTTAEPEINAFAGLYADLGATNVDRNTMNVVVGSATNAALKNDFSAGDPAGFSDVSLNRNQPNTTFNLYKNGSAAGTADQVIKDDNLNPATTSVSITPPITLIAAGLPPQAPVPASCTLVAALELPGKDQNRLFVSSNNLNFLNQSYQSPSEMLADNQPLFNRPVKAEFAVPREEIIAVEKAFEAEGETNLKTQAKAETSGTNYLSFAATFFSNTYDSASEFAGKLGAAISPTVTAQKAETEQPKDSALAPQAGETVRVDGTSNGTGSGFTLPANETTTITFRATVNANSTATSIPNTANVTAAGGINQNSNTVTTAVVQPPTISKAFGASFVAVNGTTSLTFTITNPNPSQAISQIAFTDTLPIGLVVAATPTVVNNCGGTVTATAGSGSISLANGSRPAGANCTITFNVTGTTDGAKNNTTGAISSLESGAGATSNTATLNVVAAPTFTKAFGASSIPLNGSTSLSFTITNNSAAFPLNNVGFTDALPSGLVVATPPNQTGACGGGTITATAGAATIGLSGGTLAATGNCTFSVNVTGTTAGTKNNSVTLSTTELGNSPTATATLTVVAPPTIAKSFSPTGILVNETSTLTISITNPSANVVALTGVGVTDNFPSGLEVDSTPSSTNSCATGTFTPTAGAAGISISGATISAGATCAFSVKVKATTSGAKNNVTGNVTSANGGAGGTASATLTVTQSSFSISGTVIYGTTPSGDPVKYVPDVMVNAAGTPPVSTTTDSLGIYSLNGLGAGPYTVTPSKASQTDNTGFSLQDASEAAKIAFNINTTPTANQLIAADATGDGTVTLQDASEIAKRTFNIASTNIVGQWKFVPPARTYASLTSDLTGENYQAILVGDVTGNWTAPSNLSQAELTESETTESETTGSGKQRKERLSAIDNPHYGLSTENELPTENEQPKEQRAENSLLANVPVSLPNSSGSAATTVLIPITVGDLTGLGITSYETTVSFDSTILVPASPAFDTAGTLTGAAGGYSVLVDPTQPTGRIRIGAFGTTPLSGQSVLLYLRFNVLVGTAATSRLDFVRFIFGESGNPPSATTNGSFMRLGTTAASVSLSGRVITAEGRGISKAVLTLTDQNGDVRFALTNPFGFYHFADITAGHVVVLSVKAKRYEFAQPTIVLQINEELSAMDFTGMPSLKSNLKGVYK